MESMPARNVIKEKTQPNKTTLLMALNCEPAPNALNVGPSEANADVTVPITIIIMPPTTKKKIPKRINVTPMTFISVFVLAIIKIVEGAFYAYAHSPPIHSKMKESVFFPHRFS